MFSFIYCTSLLKCCDKTLTENQLVGEKMYLPYRFILVRVTTAVTKHHDQSNLGGKGLFISLMFPYH